VIETNPHLEHDPLSRALLSLRGLAIGDSFGNLFGFDPEAPRRYVEARKLLPKPTGHTDDTEMALAVVEVLAGCGRINQDALARRFVERFERDPDRGYGKMARIILRDLVRGGDWRTASAAAFGGSGSMGNGGAMRVAPLGAWFADDLEALIREAKASAEVTHSHPEGQAGAVAVAAAAAYAWRLRGSDGAGGAMLEGVLAATPESETRRRIGRVVELIGVATAHEVAAEVGNGYLVTAQDTVPYALWCAATYAGDYVEALVETVSTGGDADTNCAIVGGIVALSAGLNSIPSAWLDGGEPYRVEPISAS